MKALGLNIRIDDNKNVSINVTLLHYFPLRHSTLPTFHRYPSCDDASLVQYGNYKAWVAITIGTKRYSYLESCQLLERAIRHPQHRRKPNMPLGAAKCCLARGCIPHFDALTPLVGKSPDEAFQSLPRGSTSDSA